jgi:hypothetical protein
VGRLSPRCRFLDPAASSRWPGLLLRTAASCVHRTAGLECSADAREAASHSVGSGGSRCEALMRIFVLDQPGLCGLEDPGVVSCVIQAR